MVIANSLLKLQSLMDLIETKTGNLLNNSSIFEQVPSINYLGAIVNQQCNAKIEVRSRMSKYGKSSATRR